MRIELRPAVYELLALLRVTVFRPESSTTRACGVGVLLLMPFFAVLAAMANRTAARQAGQDERLGSWEVCWASRRYPETTRD